MAKTHLDGYPLPRESEWAKALENYRKACAEVQRAIAQSSEDGGDIPLDPVDAHESAARTLIFTPATHVLHVAQKVRAIDNLTGLSANWPGVADILTQDLMQIVGVSDGEKSILPKAIMRAAVKSPA